MKSKVSTGYATLDKALQGGFLAGSMVVLNAAAGDEVPTLLKQFLQVEPDGSLLICRTLSSAEVLANNSGQRVKVLVCSDKPVPPSKNVIPGKAIDNLTDLNLQINDALSSIQPKRIVLDILSDVLLRHKGLQTRKWLTELLERLRSKTTTTLAVLNPYMHSGEDVQAVVGLFDGNLEIVEEKGQKSLRIKWMHGVEAVEKELSLIDLTSQPRRFEPSATVAAAPSKEPRWLTPLVSRNDELSRLKASFENALGGRGSVVAMQGEAGVGKTRLMHELAIYARSKNALVLSGTASEDGLAYAPWIEIARQYVAQTSGEVLQRMLGPNASELVKLVPDLAVKVGTIPPPKSLGEQQDKLRFFEAVTQCFISICNESPLLLLFDDMQYADQPSLDLLEYLVRSSNESRVLIVCSLPPERDIEAESPLEQTLMKFNKQRLLETISVKGLDLQGTTKLIKDIFGEQALSNEFAELIFERTGGNPFFVEEVLRALVEDGTIYRTDKGWERKPIQDLTVPRSVKTALRARLTKLDPETLSILQWAAVIGSEFDFEVLKEALQLTEDMLLERLEATINQGLVVELPMEQGRLRFADPRVRELLLEDLILLKRRRYHLKIAESMEKHYLKSPESHAEALASHYSEAGDKERTLRYSIMAGDRNMSVHAYAPAIQDFKRASDLMDLEEGKNENRAAVLEKLAGCYFYAGKPKESARSYEEARSIFSGLNDFTACARISVGLSDAISRGGGNESVAYHEAISVLERGLKYIESGQESFEAAAIYSRLAWFHGLCEERSEVASWTERGLEAGEKSGNFEAISMAIGNKGALLTDTGRIDEGLTLWERALELSLQHEQYLQAFRASLNLGVYWYPRDLTKAREFMLKRLELAIRLNDIVMQATSLGWLSYVDMLKGDWANARNEGDKAFEIFDRLGSAPADYYKLRRAKLQYALEGSSDEFERFLQSLIKRDSTMSSLVEVNLELGQLRMEQERDEEARVYFESNVDAFKGAEFSTQPLNHIETLLYLTLIYARQGEIDKARNSSQWAKRLAVQLNSTACMALGLQAEASLLLAVDDRKGAEAAYLECLALWEKAGWPYYHAKALVAYSEAIAETNIEGSRKYLQQATEIFRKLGAKRDLEKAQSKIVT